MSQDGAVMDAVASRLEATVTGMTTERGLTDPADRTVFPHAWLYDPSLEVTNIEYQQREETLTFFVLCIFSGAQEAVLASVDAFRLDLAADPYAGAEATLKAQGVRRVAYQGHALAESPEEKRVIAQITIQADRVTS